MLTVDLLVDEAILPPCVHSCMCIIMHLFILIALISHRLLDTASKALHVIWHPFICLKKGMATHSCILAWRLPWTEEPGGLQSLGLLIFIHDYSDLACTHACASKGFPGDPRGKEPTCQCRRYKRCWFNPWIVKIPWRMTWQPTPVFLPGKSLGQRCWADYSP